VLLQAAHHRKGSNSGNTGSVHGVPAAGSSDGPQDLDFGLQCQSVVLHFGLPLLLLVVTPTINFFLCCAPDWSNYSPVMHCWASDGCQKQTR